MRKILKKVGLTLMTMLLTFMLTAPSIVSAGVYVDEEANPVAEDAVPEEETEAAPVTPEPEEPTQPTEQEASQPDEGVNANPTVDVIRNPMEGESNPFVRQMNGLLSGDTSIGEMNLKRQGSLRAAPGVLDITVSSISITSAGYTYNGTTELYTGVYNISGTTAANSIVVESGNITMNLADISIDLGGQENIPAIHVKAGATLNLVLASTPGAATTLIGSKFASAIHVERGATLNVSGQGTLYAKGGPGGAGIGGSVAAPTGGRVVFASASAKVIAYSDNVAGAINMYSVSATMAKLVHGMMNASEVKHDGEQTVIVDNRDDSRETYTLKVPAGYSSFAVTTTAKGGEYISYKLGEQLDSKLLGTATGAHVYNLLNANEVATLTDITSKVVTYKVTLHANSGKFGSSSMETILIDVPFGKQVPSPEEPVKDSNNTVEGWYRNIEGTASAKWDFGSDEIVKDTTLYVKWKPTKCYVRFVPAYEGGTVTQKEYAYGDKIPDRDIPPVSNSGKVLGGWYTNATPSVKWDFANDTVTKENLTLTAVWLNEYNVTFVKNTTDAVQNMPANTKVTHGMTISPNEPRRDNWAFTGWYTDSNGTKKWDVSNDTVKAATTLYAGWAVAECTVKYETGKVDGNNGSAVADASVAYKGIISKPASVTMAKREGEKPTTYSVEGWYTEKEFKNKWDFQTPLVSKTATFTLYAKWHQDFCYVTFAGDGGSAEDDDGTKKEILTKKFNYKDPAVDPGFKKEGYDLQQWNKGTVKYDLTAPMTQDIELKAVWKIKSYNVVFDAKGGSPVPGPRLIQYNAKVPQVTAPIKPGYVFSGWYTKDTYESTSEWDFATSTMPAKDITLYAKWEPIIYTVLYRADGGTPNPELEEPETGLEYNSKVTKPADMTKAHYEFAGWYAKEDLTGNKWDFDTNVIGDAKGALEEDEENLTGTLTLHAKWNPEVYKVTFDTSNASCERGEEVPGILGTQKKQDVVYNTPTKRPAYPSEAWKGHTLEGWYTDPGFVEGSKWSFEDEEPPTLIDQDTTLYAKWTCDKYKTYFVQTEEDPVWSGNEYHYGDLVDPKPDDPAEIENYEFEGWYKDAGRTDGNKWNFAEHKMEQDTTFYANYLGEPRILNVYIKYEEGNPKYRDPIKQVKNVRYGDQLALSDIVNEENEHTKKRPGYTLTGWTVDEEGMTPWNFENDRIGGAADQETNLYGVWSRDKYEITFETYEGDPNPIPIQIGEYEDKATKPSPDPVRTHYQFGGWFKEKKLENEWNFGADLIYGHTTIYSKWIPNVYQLLFETNGGSKLASIDVEYGTLIPEEALATTKEGYDIAGWYRDAEFTQPFDVTKDFVDADKLKLYVRWELKSYTVKYSITDETTGEEVIEVDPKTYHVGNKLKKPVFEKEHMTLSTWYQDSGFQEKWLFKRDTVKGDTTIYAYWSETLYKVHFETYGGTEIADLELVWGSQFEKPADPEKTGHTFTGWYADGTYTTLWDFEEDFVDGNTNIYAGWSANTYTVTFEGDGGAPVPEPMTLPFGSLIPKPGDPVKEGFNFKGWKPSGQGAKADGVWNFETDTMPVDLTLTATWEAVVPDPPVPVPEPPAPTNTDKTPGADTLAKAAEELKKAADNLVKVMTGDEAPLLWSIVGVMLSAIALVRLFIKKMK